MYCPGGNWEPLAVSEGHYSVGGHGPNIRTGQVREGCRRGEGIGGNLDAMLCGELFHVYHEQGRCVGLNQENWMEVWC